MLCLISCATNKPATNNEDHTIQTLSEDGAWCWFSDPRAIYRHDAAKEVVTGWVTADGSIQTAILNLQTDAKKIQTIGEKLDKDDHANPAFVELKNKDILTAYTKHFDYYVRTNRLPQGQTDQQFAATELVDPFSEEELKKFPLKRTTYANPFSLKSENGRLYVFGRWTGFKPNMMWSDDNGKTFSKAKVFITNYPFDENNRPYVKYYSDGDSKIHIVFTDGHPRIEPTNSVYYACYENGAFWKADGTKICDLEDAPFEPKDASVIYKATEETGRSWIYDLAEDENENPVILYARYPIETEHLYHYAVYQNGKWIDNQICNSGKWFPQTIAGEEEREQHYSAALTVNPLQPNTIYLSKNINGIFEIEKRITKDAGKSWEVYPITQNSKLDNIRPIFPKNMRKGDPAMLLWMESEKYVHYTDYKTRIKYLIDD